MQGIRRIAVLSSLLAAVVAGCAAPVPMGAIAGPGAVGALAQRIDRLDPTLPKAESRPVTMLSYVAMDDHLNDFATMYLNALESTANPRVNAVAFADFQGPDTSFLFKIQPDRDINKVTSPKSFLSPKVKEVTANDPANVTAVVNWAYNTHPGQFQAMTMFAHGGGFLGLGTDEYQPGKTDPNQMKQIMSVSEFGDALRKGLKGRKIELMNMLSCLMGNVEYAYELKDSVDVLIASEDSIYATPDTTAAFTAELHKQLGAPNPDARVIGKRMAIFGNARHENSGYLTIAAIDLTKLDSLRQSVNVLSNAMLRAMPASKAEIVKAYDAVPKLQLDEMGQRDLWAFCNQLQSVNNPNVRKAALDTKAALRQVIIHARDKEGPAANGLSITMPPRAIMKDWSKHPLIQASLKSRFAKATSWDSFIAAIAAITAK
jgi:hypothetical protein